MPIACLITINGSGRLEAIVKMRGRPVRRIRYEKRLKLCIYWCRICFLGLSDLLHVELEL